MKTSKSYYKSINHVLFYPSRKTTMAEAAEGTLTMKNGPVKWDLKDFILPSCTCVTVLCQLHLLSNDEDFTMVEKGKNVQYIKHPESFRACLLQLTHESWDAFNTAERNMNKVLQNVSVIPEMFDSIAEILTHGTEKDISDLLPYELKNITERSSKCLAFTKECEDVFDTVKNLIGEVSELCAAKDKYFKEKGATYETLQKEDKDLGMKKGQHERNITEAKETYDKKLEEIPGFGSVIGGLFSLVPKMVFSLFKGEDGKSLHQKYVEQKKTEAHEAKENISKVEKMYEATRNEQRKKREEMRALVRELGMIGDKPIRVGEQKRILIEGMELISKIREQWGNLTRFFQNIADAVSQDMNAKVHEFTDLADIVSKGDLSDIKIKKILGVSEKAKKHVNYIESLAEFYVDVSRRHLMPGINQTFTIEANAHGTQQTDRNVMRKQITDGHEKTCEELEQRAGQIMDKLQH